MRKNKLRVQRGFTIIELVIAAAIGLIITLGIAVILVDSQRGWQKMYNNMYSDIVTDGYAARRAFDAIVRKASRERISLDDAGNWAEVYYYADSDSAVVDRYARFYYVAGDDSNNSSGQVYIEYGIVGSDGVKETSSIQMVCENVSDCVFKEGGSSVQMILTLDDGSQAATVMSSAVMHNQ